MESNWKFLKLGGGFSAPVRRIMVRSLYDQPSSIVMAVTAGVVSASVAASTSGSTALLWLSILLATVAVARIALVFRMGSAIDSLSLGLLENAYMLGAFAYSLVLGITTAVGLVANLDPAMQSLLLVNTAGYGVAVCARNAANPTIAMGQLAFSIVPLAVVAFFTGSTGHILLAASAIAFLPAMGRVVQRLSGTLQSAIRAAQTNAELADRMQDLARTDVVTGLLNRAGLNHATVERLACASDSTPLALFWFDLDRFKEVNDVLGHQVGDRVLAEVGKRLRETAPADAVIGRFGGDEFIVLCEVENRAACQNLASRLLDNVTRPLRINGERLEVPASCGIAVRPEDGGDIDGLMQSADLALYHAKTGGKNHCRFYDHAMSRALVRRREIESELRAAIQRDELSIFFQPIIDLETGRIRTFEALVRWFHPQKGELKPDEFIPVAEETGVIVTLGNWITRQAARAATHWPDDVTLAVNLSPLQIKAPGAAMGILAALRETGLCPSRLELEVTESLFLDDSSHTAAFMDELTAAGVRFALDDFGTGYSSLAYIDKYPFSKIKVDRSFVSGGGAGLSSKAIVRAVAELGNQLGLAIVAEGIETVEQVEAVRASGCTLGQGYYFSRAVPDYLAAMLLAQERETDRPLKRA